MEVAITPGSGFMYRLSLRMTSWIHHKIMSDERRKKPKIFFSGVEGLSVHKDRCMVLRECPFQRHNPSQFMTRELFQLVDFSILRTYIDEKVRSKYLPTLDIRESALHYFFGLYADVLSESMNGYITDRRAEIHWLRTFMEKLAVLEEAVLKERLVQLKQSFPKWKNVLSRPETARSDLQPATSQSIKTTDEPLTLPVGYVMNIRFSDLGQLSTEVVIVIPRQFRELFPLDFVKMQNVSHVTTSKLKRVPRKRWKKRKHHTQTTLRGPSKREIQYYCRGCISWNFIYPHHYAPTASDIVEYLNNSSGPSQEFELSNPLTPLAHLLVVLSKKNVKQLPGMHWTSMWRVLDFLENREKAAAIADASIAASPDAIGIQRTEKEKATSNERRDTDQAQLMEQIEQLSIMRSNLMFRE
ncbi:5'-3' exoribonuclease 1-like [Planoprotostelium fungivorum]|uniref:5'-3' exoribonuclease 1-like n=1 Tax=Planoprotostelium fungivorum TaxID=1890364 RepID=A0A2P6MZD9_9EUKA|nr:5'-3' exoribonuclease 1-like [Planoprotostelium fungivorum]